MVGSNPRPLPCQRPADQYAEQLRERRGPPKHAEVRVRRSFNGTESGTEFPGRCLYALCEVGKNVKTIQGLQRHAKASTTLDLYSQAIDVSKLAAQRDIALAITSNQVQAN